MTLEKERSIKTGSTSPSCDIRVWSGSCQHSEFTNQGDKYLCSTCGKIASLNHEVSHDQFPHIKAEDESNLS